MATQQDPVVRYASIKCGEDFLNVRQQMVCLIRQITQKQLVVLYKHVLQAVSRQSQAETLIKAVYALGFITEKLDTDYVRHHELLVSQFNELFACCASNPPKACLSTFLVMQYLALQDTFYVRFSQVRQSAKFVQFLIYTLQHGTSTDAVIVYLLNHRTLVQLLFNKGQRINLLKYLLKFRYNLRTSQQLIGLLIPQTPDLLAFVQKELSETDSVRVFNILQLQLKHGAQPQRFDIPNLRKYILENIQQYVGSLPREIVGFLGQFFAQPFHIVFSDLKIELLGFFVRQQMLDQYLLSALNIQTNELVMGTDRFFLMGQVFMHDFKILSPSINQLTSNLQLLGNHQLVNYLITNGSMCLDQLCFKAIAALFREVETEGRILSSQLLVFLNRVQWYRPDNQFSNMISYLNGRSGSILPPIRLQVFNHEQRKYICYRPQSDDVEKEIWNGVEEFRAGLQMIECGPSVRENTPAQDPTLATEDQPQMTPPACGMQIAEGEVGRIAERGQPPGIAESCGAVVTSHAFQELQSSLLGQDETTTDVQPQLIFK